MFLLIDETISIVYGTHSTIIGMVRYSNRMARMTDRETEQRMLSAALSLVHDRGISTGLESLPFDEVIRAAEVSRTSAYRRWPQRERFYGEVLTELARGATLPAPGEDLMISVANILAERAEHLDSPQDHRDLVVELLRVSIGADFDIVSTSPQWRTYRLLLASYQGISDPAVREAVTEALVESDQRAVTVRSRVYAQFAALLGYRLVAPLNGPDGFELMSRAAGASMMGVLAGSRLGTVRCRFRVRCELLVRRRRRPGPPASIWSPQLFLAISRLTPVWCGIARVLRTFWRRLRRSPLSDDRHGCYLEKRSVRSYPWGLADKTRVRSFNSWRDGAPLPPNPSVLIAPATPAALTA